jgi:hypothetical protein
LSGGIPSYTNDLRFHRGPPCRRPFQRWNLDRQGSLSGGIQSYTNDLRFHRGPTMPEAIPAVEPRPAGHLVGRDSIVHEWSPFPSWPNHVTQKSTRARRDWQELEGVDEGKRGFTRARRDWQEPEGIDKIRKGLTRAKRGWQELKGIDKSKKELTRARRDWQELEGIDKS